MSSGVIITTEQKNSLIDALQALKRRMPEGRAFIDTQIELLERGSVWKVNDRNWYKNQDQDWGYYERAPIIQTTREYNLIAKAIERQDTTWLLPLVKICRIYYSDRFISGGTLHIVLDDDNIDDRSVAWCAGYAAAHNDRAGSDIAELMLLMKKSQRAQLLACLNNLDAEEGGE